MYTTTAHKNNSTKKTYLFNRGDEHLGRELNSNDFITHASIVVREGQKWNFNAQEALQEANNPEFIQYKKTWNDKWQLVKDVLCSPDYYDCELLDYVIDV